MKHLLIFLLGLSTLTTSAQDDKVWRFGLQFGNCSNKSKQSAGMQVANGRFNQNTFDAPNINFVARYDFNKHWMVLTGLGLNAVGFAYSISEDYSLNSIKRKVSDIRTIFPTVEVPLSLFFKFDPNCKNIKWVVGAGIAPTLGAQLISDKDFSLTSEGKSTNYLSSHSVSNGGAAVLVRLSIGREKMYKNGSILQASLLLNMGFNTTASSTVNYTLDNQNYSHTFTNNGSSVGFRLAYFLKPKSKL